MPQLAEPERWAPATLRQAWADFLVAEHLSEYAFPPDDPIRRGRPAYDAALDKYQQCLEKLLKAFVLRILPHRSDLVFKHRILDDLDDELRRWIELLFAGASRVWATPRGFRALEGLVPGGFDRSVRDSRGRVVELPENSQYPYTRGSRSRKSKPEVVAPCDALASAFVRRFGELAKDIEAFLFALSRLAAFENDFEELRVLDHLKAVRRREGSRPRRRRN